MSTDLGECHASAFVSTNSICQGRQVDTLWSLLLGSSHHIDFAHTSFKWANLASHNAGVTVVIVGLSNHSRGARRLFTEDSKGNTLVRQLANINPYLTGGPNIVVKPASEPLCFQNEMSFGSMPNDGGHLLLTSMEAIDAIQNHEVDAKFIRPFLGSQEFIRGQDRRCIWVTDQEVQEARANDWLSARFNSVRLQRTASDRSSVLIYSF